MKYSLLCTKSVTQEDQEYFPSGCVCLWWFVSVWLYCKYHISLEIQLILIWVSTAPHFLMFPLIGRTWCEHVRSAYTNRHSPPYFLCNWICPLVRPQVFNIFEITSQQVPIYHRDKRLQHASFFCWADWQTQDRSLVKNAPAVQISGYQLVSKCNLLTHHNQ